MGEILREFSIKLNNLIFNNKYKFLFIKLFFAMALLPIGYIKYYCIVGEVILLLKRYYSGYIT